MPRSLPWTWETPLHNLSDALRYGGDLRFRIAAAYDHVTYGFHPRLSEGCLPARGHRLAHGDDDTKNSGRKMYRN